MKTLIIAGGTGFLGHILESHFKSLDFQVKILTRKPVLEHHIYWNAQELGKWQEELEGTDLLINLTGKSVDCRYTSENKKKIYDSRILSTHLLGLAINLCENPPKVWLNSSTATIYKDSYHIEMSEESGEIGDDFSMNIAKSWEKAFYSIVNPKTRKASLRTSIVMGKNGGALKPLKQITKLGIGGKQSSGQQKVSWIHETDFARAVYYIYQNKEMEGSINLSVPKPTNNQNLMSSLRKVLNIPIGIPQPKWLIIIGAKIIGTEPELVLKSRNVIPTKLLKNGFTFNFHDIDIALTQILKT